nr:hypothetical protein GCM10020093_005270 [Planobispora longispora]
MLLWRARRGYARSSSAGSQKALAEAEADLAEGHSVSTIGYEVFSIKEYTIGRYHGSYTVTRVDGGTWRLGLPYRHTRRSMWRELTFALKTGAAYVADADIVELTLQLRRVRSPR